ncbi:unnamed protein product, partial [Rotaria sp. Silwood2]
SDNPEIFEIVRGNLIQSAGLWFDNNEQYFKNWTDFETAFRNRYLSTTMMHTKFDKLQQREQLHDEPITSYFDDVIKLYREIDSNMSDSIIHHMITTVGFHFTCTSIGLPNKRTPMLNYLS